MENKPLTLKEHEIKTHTYIQDNIANLKILSLALVNRDKLKFENSKKVVLNNEELISLLNSEIKLTQKYLLDYERAEMSRIIDLSSREYINSIDSLSDETFTNTMRAVHKNESGMSEMEIQKIISERSHFTIEDEDKLGYQIVGILNKRLYFDFLKLELEKAIKLSSLAEMQPIVKWTKDKTDFYKLIYALFHSKSINEGEGEITKIMQNIAPIFGVNLAKNWQSGSSKNKGIDNGGYNSVEFFENLQKGYLKYVDTLERKKAK